MEDNDWTDNPLISCVEYQDSNSDTEKNTNSLLYSQNEKTSETVVERNDIQESSNSKQEKESCPICLSSFEDKSFLDQCFHSFCFCCILQWCEVVQTCPLCKSGFASIIHNVKTVQDYEQYIVEKKSVPDKTSDQTQDQVTYDEHGFDGHGNRFRYRSTQQLHTRPQSNISHSHLHSRQRTLRTINNASWGDEARTRRHTRRNHERTIKGVERRRQIYAFKLRAIGSLGSGKQRSRNISSKFYKSNAACTHRLIPWLLRDLKVLLGNNEKEVNFLVEFILSLITRIDMDSELFVEELRPFLLQTTEHFVHELLSFAKAPFDMNAYSECVVYPRPEESNHEDRTGRPFEHTQNRTSNREWINSTNDPHQVLDETKSLSQDKRNEIFHSIIANLDNRREIGETSTFAARTESNAVRIGDESGRTANNEESLEQDEDSSTVVNDSSKQMSNSIDHHVDITPSSAVNCLHRRNNVVLESEERSDRHRRHKHGSRHKHKHKYKHKRRSRHKTNPSLHPFSESGSSSTCISERSTPRTYFQVEEPVGDVESKSVKQPESPTVERMRSEIDELNILIRQHEQELLNLGKR